MLRKPFALANWKMTMTVAEGLDFVHGMLAILGDQLKAVDVVICPPFTTLYPLSQSVQHGSLQLGGQNCAATTDIAHTGEISAALLADVGCRWVMLGHWETRRHLGDDDASVNRKIHLAQAAGLIPIPLVGEGHGQAMPEALARQLPRVLEAVRPEDVAGMVFVYEPEGKIGQAAPLEPAHAAAGCRFIRTWISEQLGASTAAAVRIIYGGSVTPAHAPDLLAASDIDGLGASSRGRDAATFADIVRQVVRKRSAIGHQRSAGT